MRVPDPRTPTLKSPKRRLRAPKLAQWRAGLMAGTALLTITTGVTTVGVEAFAAGQAICLDGTITGTSCGGSSVGWNPALFVPGTTNRTGTRPGDITYAGTANHPPNVGSGSTGYTGLADFGAPDYATPDQSYFGLSNKDTQDTSTWKCIDQNNPANKQDLQNAYAAVYRRNSDNHRLLYVGSERYDNSGDAFQGFWFFQNATSCSHSGSGSTNFATAGHVNGDLLVLSNYTQGGLISGINLYKWDTTCTGPNFPTNPLVGQCADNNLRLLVTETNDPICGTTAGNADIACGITNGANITPPWNVAPLLNQTLVPRTFLELGLDLDNPTIASAVGCGSSFQAETRESQSTSAALKDFVGGPMDICSPSQTTTAMQQQNNGTWGSLTSGSSINTGTPVRDTATITPAPQSSDNVTFKLYSGSGCDSSNTPTGSLVSAFGSSGSSTVAYGGGPATSASISTLAPGTYQFQASWAGDASIQLEGSTSDCGSEVFTVLTPTQTATQLSSDTVSVNDTVSDTATITGATSAAGGSVDFSVYQDNSCETLATSGSGGQIDAQPTQSTFVNNSGTITATSSSVKFKVAGTYYWEAVYSGDLTNFTIGSHSPCDSEPITVNAPLVSITKTTTDTSPVNAGTTINYTITVTNTSTDANAYGVTVTDDVPTNAGLSWSIQSQSPASSWTLSNNTLSWGPATLGPGASASVTITSPTTVATCGTVSNFASATTTNDGNPQTDPVVITVNCPTTTTTQLSATSISVGQTASDSATVSGASPSAGGTVSFAVYTNNTCSTAATTGSSGQILAQPTTLTDVNNGDGTISATSSSVTFLQAGTYYWQASYTGDATHNTSSSKSACGSEVITVLAPALSLTKTADHTAAVQAGTPIGFTVSFANSSAAGTGTALGVLLSDPLPNVPSTSTDNFSWVIDGTPTLSSDLVSLGVTCQISPATATSGQTLYCGLGSNSQGVFNMIPGSSISVHMTHQTDSASSGTYPNTAKVACVNQTTCPLSASASEAVFVAAVSPVLPAKTGDWSIFMVLGAPFILLGILLLAMSRRRREGEA